MLAEKRPTRPLQPSTDYARWSLLPVNARKGVAALAAKHADLTAWSETCRWNRLDLGHSGSKFGVIAAGIAVNENWIRIAPVPPGFHSDDVREGQTMLPHLLRAGVTAVFCYNDMVAVGVLMACRDLGLTVPEQLSVVGYDDVELARYVTPPLTTIHQPKLRLGELGMQMLLDILDGHHVQNCVLPNDLVVRASTMLAPAVRACGR